VHYLGLISLYIAFGSALLAVLAGARAQARTRLSRRANLLSSLAVALSTLVLVFAFLSNDFRLAYVARNSARSLPVLYKISALWAGQSGSLLLWLLVISLFSLAVQRKSFKTSSCAASMRGFGNPVNAFPQKGSLLSPTT
jgi:cytochrome c-type biogenesis protein CcmF